MLGPLPRRDHGVHLPVSSPMSSAFPNRGNESADPRQPANTIFRGAFFEVANISLCSGLLVCSPPRSFLPLHNITAGQLRLLRPSRACFVTSHASDMLAARIGNWRHGDSHPARFAALSAAPLCSR
jgi:hypothetical protein